MTQQQMQEINDARAKLIKLIYAYYDFPMTLREQFNEELKQEALHRILLEQDSACKSGSLPIRLLEENQMTQIFKNKAEFNKRADKTINGVSKKFLEKNNLKLEDIKLTNCINCWNCTNCTNCDGCENCDDCWKCDDCNGCWKCKKCKNCNYCWMCDDFENCTDYLDI